MKFNGSSTAHSGGVEVVLYHEEDKAVALSFKLEFTYKISQNLAQKATTYIKNRVLKVLIQLILC